MKLTTPDGKVHEGSLRMLCVGFVARSIELEPRDCTAMLALLDRDHNELRAILMQLRARFESERAPARLVHDPLAHHYKCPAREGGECRCPELGGYL